MLDTLCFGYFELSPMIVCHCFQAGSAAKQGLHELETVISSATSLGLKLPVSKNT